MTLTNIMLLYDGSVPTNAELRPGSDSRFEIRTPLCWQVAAAEAAAAAAAGRRHLDAA